MMNVTPYIIFLIFSLFIYILGLNFSKYFNSKKYIKLAMMIPIFLIIMQFLYENNNFYWLLFNDVWFYTYILQPIFPILLLIIIERYYVFFQENNDNALTDQTPPEEQNDKILKCFTKRTFISACFLLIFTAVSNEYFRFIICSGLFIGFVLHLLTFKKTVNLIKAFLVYACIVILNISTFFIPCTQRWLQETNNHYTFSDILSLLPTIINSFSQNIFVKNLYLWGILLFLTVVFLFLQNNDRKKRITIFLTSIITSLLLFQIIIIGSTDKAYGFQFSFEHIGMIFFTKITLLYVILSLAGYILAEVKNKSKIFIILVCLGCFGFNFDRNCIKMQREQEFFVKILYMWERLFFGYSRESKIYYSLPAELKSDSKYAINYFINLYDRGANPKDYTIQEICTTEKNSSDLPKCCEDELKRLVKEKTGYVFSDEELNNPDFSKYNNKIY